MSDNTNTIQDIKALLRRYQNELAEVTTRAIVAEALLEESRNTATKQAAELAGLRLQVAAIDAQMGDGNEPAQLEAEVQPDGALVEVLSS